MNRKDYKELTIIKALALAMLMPAMLLTTACSNDDNTIINNEQTAKKGYPLSATVNVTRQGYDAATRTSYNEETKKLEFSAGDKLFVSGKETCAGFFAGMLDYVPASGKFNGTIFTQNKYEGTAEALFTAASTVSAKLLPAGYETPGYFSITGTGYEANLIVDKAKAFATSTAEKTAKATALEQFCIENASAYSSGFALHPLNAILNFTITDLTASTNFTATLKKSGSDLVSGSVTTDGSGNATFAVGVLGDTDFNDLALSVGGKAITLTSSSKTLAAGKIYNVTGTTEKTETFHTDLNQFIYIGTHFKITGTRKNKSGILNIGGGTITITARNRETIKTVKFYCNRGADYASKTSVTAGTLYWKKGYWTGTISTVNASTVEMSNSEGGQWVLIDEITVYY